MKRLIATILLALCTGLACAQNIDQVPALAGADVDAANDKILVRDASVDAADGALRQMSIADLVNVPELFSSLATQLADGSISASKLSAGGASLNQALVWNGTAWAAATVSSDLTSGPVTSSGGVSAIADGAISGAKISSIPPTVQTALDAKQASLGGVILATNYGPPQTFTPSSNSDAARWAAFAAANTAATADAGQTITCPGGNYLFPGTQYILKSGVTYHFGRARFYLGANASSANWLLSVPSGATNTTISGGVFDNNGYTIASGWGWFYIDVPKQFLIRDARFVNTLTSFGLIIEHNSSPQYTGAGKVQDCHFLNSTGIWALSEFVEISGCKFDSGPTGAIIRAGNVLVDRCIFVGQTVDQVAFTDGSNDSHDIVSNCLFAHGTGNILRVDDAVTNGVTITGCNIYGESSTQGYLDLSGSGVQIVGGILDCLLRASTTPTGDHFFRGCQRPLPGVTSNVTDAQMIAGLSTTAKMAKFRFLDMKSAAGDFAYNEPSGDVRQTNNIAFSDEFIGGGNTSFYIGGLGWHQYGTGTGVATAPWQAGTGTNAGMVQLTSGNASGDANAIYLPSTLPLLTTPGWTITMVFKASQSTLCDVIAGVTTDTSAVGIGKFGATCFGLRYSSAVDSNFMFCSKAGNSTWAANDASNYSLSTGVAADTSYHTFRMRSVTAGAVEMKLDAGAWTAVTMVSASGNFIPYFYVSSRTSATKAMLVDYFSYVQTGVAR